MTFTMRRSNRENVRPGDLFRRRGEHHAETATVLDLSQDPVGIPHVRFTLAIEGPDAGRYDMSSRTLALHSFMDAYRERISP
jgi:hypothetical protein